jgi:hypothetical protein
MAKFYFYPLDVSRCGFSLSLLPQLQILEGSARKRKKLFARAHGGSGQSQIGFF